MFLGSTAPVPSGARTRSGLGTRSHEDNAAAVRAAASPGPLAPTHANGSDDHPTGGEGHPACGGGRVDAEDLGEELEILMNDAHCTLKNTFFQFS